MAPPSDSTPLDAALADGLWLRRLARELAGDAHRADDAVQETLLAAVERPAPARAPRAWLAAVLRNALRQERRGEERRSRRERAVGDASSSGAPSADDVAARLELQQAVFEAVRALDEPYRTAVVLRFFDGLPPRRIAARLGVPVKTVSTRLERALARLRQRLDGRYGDRATWAVALLPLARNVGPLVGPIGGLAVGTTAKLVAAAAIASAAALAVRPLLSTPEPAPIVAPRPAAEPQPLDTTPPEPRDAREPVGPATSEPAPDVSPAPLPSIAAPVAPARLTVRVVRRGTGELVPDAWVRAEAAEPPAFHTGASTGQLGFARLDVPSGQRLRLAVTPDTGAEDPLDPIGSTSLRIELLVAGEAREVVLTVPHGLDRLVRGRVVDARDGRPLAGASVRALWGEDEGGALSRVTDSAGRFELSVPSWRASCASVELEGYGPAWAALSEAPDGAPLEVRLERGGVLEVGIARADGVLVEDAEVRLTLSTADLLQPRGARVRSSELVLVELADGGVARFEDLPAGARLFAAVHGAGGELLWRSPAPVVLEPGEARRLDWTLGGGTRVRGIVQDQHGRPIEGCEVWALALDRAREGDRDRRWLRGEDRARVTSLARADAAGRYALAGLGPGEWWIGPGHFGRDGDGDVATVAERLSIEAGTPEARVDVVAHRGLAIEGRIVGDVARSAAVTAAGIELEGAWLRAAAEPDGTFRVSPLAPGRYVLRVQQPGALHLDTDPVVVAAGARDVELVAGGGGAIEGRLVDAEGRSVAGHVHLRLPGNGSLGMGVGHDGAFRFTGLEPGAYVVRATSEDGGAAVRSLELAAEGREELEVVLEPGARLVLSLTGSPDRLRCEIVHSGVVVGDFTLRRGEPAAEAVPPGPVLVQVYSERDERRTVHASRTASPAPGEVVEIVLDVP